MGMRRTSYSGKLRGHFAEQRPGPPPILPPHHLNFYLMKTSSIKGLIEAAGLVILHLSQNKDLQRVMSAFGFTLQRVQVGKKLLDDVRQTGSNRKQGTDEARRLSHQINQEGKATLQTFRDHVAIARAAFRQEPLALRELKVTTLTSNKWDGVQQALEFYEQAPKHMTQLQKFGAVPEAFQQNEAAVQALLALKAQRLDRKGKTESNTQQRNQKIKELRDWYGDFRRLARVAFKNDLQLLETFGIVVPSKPRKRKPVVKAPTEAVKSPEVIETPATEATPTAASTAAETPAIEDQP